MRVTTSGLLVAAALLSGAAVFFVSSSTASISTTAAAPKQLEVVGPGGSAVPTTVEGTVELGPGSQASIAGARNCTYTPIGNPVLDGGITTLPTAAGQTGITLVAHTFGSLAYYASCWPGDVDAGPSPNCATDGGGIGYAILEGASLNLDLTTSRAVRCTSCFHGTNAAQQSMELSGGISSCTP